MHAHIQVATNKDLPLFSPHNNSYVYVCVYVRMYVYALYDYRIWLRKMYLYFSFMYECYPKA